ncbi:ABC transporter ATP-binding protein [Allokutzneria albata]|uniref:ABC-2 type transport system ATP-binding protein n=1 Tax=Allokutzneria albata TaxID=211114 RepID=A0A1G9R6X6_ALLAB|nr:ATP-binding cassette domain-containing protein [Allokutzneria albata]SDM18984.1 ABC-2 type transport system ATP-binding protein [Allokutzneria albata]
MIEAHELTKVFKVRKMRPGLWGAVRGLVSADVEEVRALDGVSFSVPAGERTAYLGVNGAGKSTTIKSLAGVLTPTSGHCRVAGRDPRADRYAHARTIGVVFGHRTQLWWDLPVEESFRILARLHDMSKEDAALNRKLFDEVLDLGEIAHRPVRTLSLGQRMRAEVAAALFHNPRVLLLDEPTIGLDLLLKEAVHELVNRVVADRGTTVLLTSHDVADITAICERVVVVDSGRDVYTGDLDDLLRQAPTRTVRLDYSAEISPESLASHVQQDIGAVQVEVAGRRRVKVEGPPDLATPQRVLDSVSGLVTVTDLVAPEPTLGEVLRALYVRTAEPARGAR